MYFANKKHFDFMNKALNALKDFNTGEPSGLFHLIATSYGVNEADFKKAYRTFEETGLRRWSNCHLSDVCERALNALKNARKIEATDGENIATAYLFCIPFLEEDIQDLCQLFDFLCRILLGNLSEIFSFAVWNTDTDPNKKETILCNHFYSLQWEAPRDMSDARDLLVPACKGMGWSGNLGISSPKACNEAKLSYEISKVFGQTEYIRRTGQKDCILRLSGEPLMLKYDSPF